jgi:hypothetical protein
VAQVAAACRLVVAVAYRLVVVVAYRLVVVVAYRLAVVVDRQAGVAHQNSMAIPALVQSGGPGHSVAHHNYRRTPHQAWQGLRIVNKPAHYWLTRRQLVGPELRQILLQE